MEEKEIYALIFNQERTLIIKVASYGKNIGRANSVGTDANAVEQNWKIVTDDDQTIVINSRNVMFIEGNKALELVQKINNKLFEVKEQEDRSYSYKQIY